MSADREWLKKSRIAGDIGKLARRRGAAEEFGSGEVSSAASAANGFDSLAGRASLRAKKRVCFRWFITVVALGGSLLGSVDGGVAKTDQTAVEAVRNRYPESAAKADATANFSRFAPECILLGTDAAERWTVEPFKGYALPYFPRAKAGRISSGSGM